MHVTRAEIAISSTPRLDHFSLIDFALDRLEAFKMRHYQYYV